MRTYIRKLQSKPVEVRKQILVVSLVISMAFGGTIWIYGLTYRFSDKAEEVAVAEKPESVSPFKLFKDSIGGAYNNISASVGNISSGKDSDQAEPEQKQIQMIPVERNYIQ